MINIYAIVRKEKTQRKKVTFCPKGKTFNRISFVDARSYRALFGHDHKSGTQKDEAA